MELIACDHPEDVAKEAFWLAWQACGGPAGMGFLRNRPESDKDDVWQNVHAAGDYPANFSRAKPGYAYGDYVFGRMMKLSLSWTDQGVQVPDLTPRPDYQAWCRTYPTYRALVEAAIASLAKS